MKWLLDTNVISEGMRPRPSQSVLDWVDAHEGDLALSVVTLAELHYGARTLADAGRRHRFDRWIGDIVMPRFGPRTFALTLEVLIDFMALARALSARGRPQCAPDLLLASTVRVHDLILVTRNIRDFANTGITVYNPWTDETQRMEAP
jgi:predicted nucleic acid-binding protein